MPSLTREQCLAYGSRLKERTILITGAGSGFGRETALAFANLGAKVVLGDVNLTGLAETVQMVHAAHGSGVAVSAKCDVTAWDDQVALFDLGKKTFGSIDIVLPNAGISEVGLLSDHAGSGDRPTPPDMTTLEVDLIGVLYTTRLALWHFEKDTRVDPGLQCVCFTGSLSTFYGANNGPMYGASKAGILGIVKGILDHCQDSGIRAVTVCPYFTKTGLMTDDFVHPNPKQGMCNMEDVVAAFVVSITDPDHNFGCWLIPDAQGVFRMETTGQLVGAEGARRPKAEKVSAKL